MDAVQHSVRLTQLAHGGGCGCKIAPGVLRDMLAGSLLPLPVPDLLVGTETSDDAAVYRLNDHQAIVATTDFFMPVVDDPFDFGRIAATNALSDLYAMGATPLFALAIVGMPVNTLPVETIRLILQGGESVCRAAGIPIAGGHSIDAPEPIYGLVGIGVVDPARVKRNSGAQPGDLLVLGKPLGVGVYSAALKQERLDDARYRNLINTTTRLNTPGRALALQEAVHALTDVTGFGLLGHLLELCQGSTVGATLCLADLPLLPDVPDLIDSGLKTGASTRNWASYGERVVLDPALPGWAQTLLTDPQTSGGLLAAVAPDAASAVLACFHDEGFLDACVIGRCVADQTGKVQVLP